MYGERVVVAERDLIGGSGVIFVDDGNGAEAEQCVERVPDVDVGATLGDVSGGEQDLRCGETGAAECVLPCRLQPCLTESRCRLQLRKVAGTPIKAERREAERDRARGDDANRFARCCQVGDLTRTLSQERTAYA